MREKFTNARAIELFSGSEYDFLDTNNRLNNNIMYLTLSGSMSYGTNLPTSDIDLRGFALNSPYEVLGLENACWQVNDDATDTQIFSLSKAKDLLINCNPNTLELLFTREEDIIFMTDDAKLIRDNATAFLSKHVQRHYTGFCNMQKNRLQHALLSNKGAEEQKLAMLEQALNHSLGAFVDEHTDDKIDVKFTRVPISEFRDKHPTCKIENDAFTEYMLVSLHCDDIPINDMKVILDRIVAIKNDYTKFNKEFSRKKIEDRLAKHAEHLVRLMMDAIELNETGTLHTYKTGSNRDLLMDIRTGKYLTSDNDNVIPEFWELVDDYQNKLNYAVDNSVLPEEADLERIKDIFYDINKKILFNDVKA